MRRILVVLLLAVAFCLGAAVSYYNWTSVTFNYLAGETDLPLVALLLAAFVFGVLLAVVFNLVRNWAFRLEVRRLTRKLEATEAELKNLRSLSLKDA